MKLAIFLVALLGAASAVPKRTQRIVGGEATTIQQYNFMSSMLYLYWGFLEYQACGGALLTSSTILSAAHCYHGDRASDWRVRLGSTYPESGGSVFNVAQLTNHAQYNDITLVNDVSIIRLSTPATLSANIGTAQIAGTNYVLSDHTPVYAVGWGTLWSGGPSPDVLHHVQVLTINHALCTERYAYLKTLPGFGNWPDITPGMTCAGIIDVGGKDACQGDSGGPLVHNGNVVYGVTSWGYGCADATYPGVNAFVPYYADWIIANGSS